MTLSQKDIIKRLHPDCPYREKQIIVTPMLNPDDQILSSGIDLRLGKQFILFKSHLSGSLNPITIKQNVQQITKYQEETVVPMRRPIVLHPGQFILGSTLEYIGLPQDIEARIDGRSSWARMGLLIATATTIHPNFQGIVTLEMSNNGSIPIELFPGMKIAYMTFNILSSPVIKKDDSKYNYAIGPGYTRIYEDVDIDILCTP